MLVTARDLRRQLTALRSRATRGGAALNAVVNLTKATRPTAATVAAINDKMRQLLGFGREIMKILEELNE